MTLVSDTSAAETTLALFDDLPKQRASGIVQTDRHDRVQCSKCKGSGRHRYSYFGGGYYAERGSEACPQCSGAGFHIHPIGGARRAK